MKKLLAIALLLSTGISFCCDNQKCGCQKPRPISKPAGKEAGCPVNRCPHKPAGEKCPCEEQKK